MNQSKNQYATKKDLESTRLEVLDKIETTKQELLGKLASKEQLQQEVAKLATKEELQREIAKLATKEELRQEVAKLATKKELERANRSIEILANQVANNTQSIENMDHKIDMVLEAIDGVVSEIKDLKVEKSAIDHGLRRHDTRLDNHETRIHALESKVTE